MKKTKIACLSVISLLLILSGAGIVPGIAVGETVNNTSDPPHELKDSGHDFIGGEGANQMNALLLLLREMGLNISYNDDGGTIFSMVDESMTRIITDLSSGNSEGFMEIPLIRETMNYLDIAPADIIVNPDNVQASMPAIERYNSQYGHLENTSVKA